MGGGFGGAGGGVVICEGAGGGGGSVVVGRGCGRAIACNCGVCSGDGGVSAGRVGVRVAAGPRSGGVPAITNAAGRLVGVRVGHGEYESADIWSIWQL